MEGVNMPASFKFAWRWLVRCDRRYDTLRGQHFQVLAGRRILRFVFNLNTGRIKGINLGNGNCTGNTTELDWVTVGPTGPTGMQGVVGDPGLAGTQGPAGRTWNSGASGRTG